MITSLLYQRLQDGGSPALQELEDSVALALATARKKSSDTLCGGRSTNCECPNTVSSENPSSGIDCVGHRILSLSHRLVASPVPYHSHSANLRENSHSNCGESCCCSNLTEKGNLSVQCNSGVDTLAIDCVSLASATFSYLSRQFREIWKQCNTCLWLNPRPRTQEARQSNQVVWAERWWLQPSDELSTQIRLWGNAALSRRRVVAAEALYSVALSLLPNSGSKTSSQLAVLHANRSLALLRLGRDSAALRAATEAVAADPSYAKAWHRRAAALGRLRDRLERQFFHSSDAGSDPFENILNIKEMTSSCLHLIDLELTEARRMASEGATSSAAPAAAERMVIGTCGCEASSASLRIADFIASPLAPQVWLRPDVELRETGKGRGLFCLGAGKGGVDDDRTLVLEEDAFAVYVHPEQCTKLPKLPLCLCTSVPEIGFSAEPDSFKLRQDPAICLAWEERVEACAVDAKDESSTDEPTRNRSDDVVPVDWVEGVCAGCATVPARIEAATAGGFPWNIEACRTLVHHLLTPTLPTVPCGSCAGALFCCETCKAASSHMQVCRGRQQRQDTCGKNEVGVLPNSCASSSAIKRKDMGETSRADCLVRPLALALQDPHRHIARQLLCSIVPRAGTPAEQAGRQVSELAQRVSMDSRSERSRYGGSMLDEPPWRQVVGIAAVTQLDHVRLTDWLLNAIWLAGEAISDGQVRLCGGRCLVCYPVATGVPRSSQHPFEAKASASSLRSLATDQLCGMCCMCCMHWCSTCSSSPPDTDVSKGSVAPPVFFPKCLYSAALHAYGAACCNSFAIRVFCDPEEKASAAGTAFFLAASLLNHSCSPNAVAVFGEPRLRQSQQHRLQETSRLSTNKEGRLFRTPHAAVGRGTLLQVRIFRQDSCELKGDKVELCISYGPMVGLENSSWGHRQNWLRKHAGFFCLCEACSSPPSNRKTLGAGAIMFGHELLQGIPCSVCTSVSHIEDLLEGFQDTEIDATARDILLSTAAVVKRSLGPQLGAVSRIDNDRERQISVHSYGESVYNKVLTATTQKMVTSFAELLITHLAGKESRQKWTTTRTLALLGHSCVGLWSFGAHGIYVCKEFRCLHCGSLFPAANVESRAIEARLSRLRSKLIELLSPSVRIGEKARCDSLKDVVKEFMQMIPSAVATGGCLSTCMWQLLLGASRAAHAVAELQKGTVASVESFCLAATCLSAGIHVLLQRLPHGLSQPDVYAHMYKAALLYERAGTITHAKVLLRAALNATQDSCGPHSVSHSSVKERLLWMGLRGL